MPYGVFMAAYAALWLVFLTAMFLTGRSMPANLPGIDLLILSLASFRLTELVSEEKVARCIRAPFCEVVRKPGADGTEVEEEVPAGKGIRRVAGELLLCPWCIGIWIATFLIFAYLLVPNLARMVALAFAVAAGGLFFQILIKLMDRTRQCLPE